MIRKIKYTIIIIFLFVGFISSAQDFPFRKYSHVKNFYKGITNKATQICMDHNIPPAALLAIAGLESGWDSGYVGQISGNILSLGAKKSDPKLPALYLPTLVKKNKILFDSLVILKQPKNALIWKQRPKSLKKDYRPKPIAGTPYQLAYFKYHPNEKKKAHLANITDFVTTFIGRKSKIKAYRDARKKMDELVKKYGKEVLLKEETAIIFVNEIGGKINSYNYRKTWPIKVERIIKKVGLSNLCTGVYKGKTFEKSWKN